MQRTFQWLWLPLLWWTVSCSPRYAQTTTPDPVIKLASVPDYKRLNSWSAHPELLDPSDSIPGPLKDKYIPDTTVDVFFLHPTTLTSDKLSDWNGDVNDSILNDKTDYSTILFQASAFNEFRIFAPRYRQAHIRSYYVFETPEGNKAIEALDMAYLDVRNSFQYYLENHNSGKPIIIASHSQGSTHAIRLLKEFFDNKPLQKQLVAAYVIGMKIPENSFDSLQMCRDSLETGCLCGWRSYKKGYEPEFVQKEMDNAMVTNPLTWTTSKEYAPRSLNKGGVLRNFNRLFPNVADAQIHNNVLWITDLKFPGSVFLRTKNYHIGDINLFYMNIRENLRQRVSAFKESSSYTSGKIFEK